MSKALWNEAGPRGQDRVAGNGIAGGMVSVGVSPSYLCPTSCAVAASAKRGDHRLSELVSGSAFATDDLCLLFQSHTRKHINMSNTCIIHIYRQHTHAHTPVALH